MKKKELFYNMLLVIIGLLVIGLSVGFNNVYGSSTDWIYQHFTIPEYFRTLFYSTGDLFPNFAPNIGLGQNIYNLAYYGLFSPIILFSYLLPFVKMSSYIIFVSILGVFVSTMLMYRLLKSNKYNDKEAFLVSVLFLLAGPIIFHSHRHIMFTSYFLFLFLALFGVDKYLKEKKYNLLIISILLIILTNYYYAVSSLIVVGIYGIYKYLEMNKKLEVKKSIIDLIKYVGVMLTGVGLSLFYLVPVFFSLTGGERTDSIVRLKDLIIPNFDLNNIVGSPYSMGLSAIAILGLLYGYISKKKENIFLSIVITAFSFIPLFLFLLNGGLYIRAKALIPFIPLLLLLVASMVKYLKNTNLKYLFGITLIFSIITFITGYTDYRYYLVLLVTVLLVYLTKRYKNINILLVSMIIMSSIYGVIANKKENFVSKARYDEAFNNSKNELINSVTTNDDSFYRFNDLTDSLVSVNKIYNSKYFNTSIYSSTYNDNFYKSNRDEFNNNIEYRNKLINNSSNNIITNTYYGVKYILDKSNPSVGYKEYIKDDNYKVYKNDNVFKLGYINYNTITYNLFNKLANAEKNESLLKYTIYKGGKLDYDSNIENKPLDIKDVEYKNIKVTKEDGYYSIDAKDNAYMIVNLNEPIDNKILFLEFENLYNNNCKEGDMEITINGQSNKLTCSSWLYHNQNYKFNYTISSNEPIDKLTIKFTKGKHQIKPGITSFLDYDKVVEYVNNNDYMTDIKVKGDKITGKINAKKRSVLVLTIPYDEGFNIKVNGVRKQYMNINKGYIGVFVDKGDNDIEVTYTAKGTNLGRNLSILSIIILIYLNIKKKLFNK